MLTVSSKKAWASDSGTDMVAAGAPRLLRRESGEADSLARFRFCPGLVETSERSGCGALTVAAMADCGVVNPAAGISPDEKTRLEVSIIVMHALGIHSISKDKILGHSKRKGA